MVAAARREGYGDALFVRCTFIKSPGSDMTRWASLPLLLLCPDVATAVANVKAWIAGIAKAP